MHIGPQREYERHTSLHDYFSDTGYGIMGIMDWEELPKEMIEFCFSQYDRFGIPRPPIDVVGLGAWATYQALDFQDPYILFFGVSDVNFTSEWMDIAYDIHDTHNGKVIEADPERIETYRYVPGQSEAAFNHFMSRPGLENLPESAHGNIEMCLDGEWTGEELCGRLSDDDEAILRDLCKEADGTVNGKKFRSYFSLSAWAAWCWFIGPLSKEWRFNNHDIFYICIRDGECIIYDGTIIEKEHYKRLDRSPKSCANCGLSAWCVDMVQIQGTTRHACEHCLNGSAPLFEEATCGSKACRNVECQYNKYHGLTGGLQQMLRKTGQLSSMVKTGEKLLRSHPQAKQLEAQ